MEKENKRLLQVVVVLVLLFLMLWNLVYHPIYATVGNKVQNANDTVCDYDHAKKELKFWYTDESYTDYYKTCAKRFFDETGIAVEVTCKDSLGFLETIYQNTMEDTNYPDVYMIQNDSLGKVCLYGLAKENENAGFENENYAENAVEASSCEGKLYGYPLTFHTGIFVYQTEAFAEAPKSIQEILDLAENSEIGLKAGNLIEWNVADAYYDFPFIGNSITFDALDAGELQLTVDEDSYEQELAYYQGLSDTINLDTDTITRPQVLEDFSIGATLCAIVDSDDLREIHDMDYSVSMLPALNEELSMRGASYTKMLIVNDYTKESEKAAAFAKFVTTDCVDDLEKQTGYLPVKRDAVTDKKSKLIYQQYENSVNMPNAMNSEEFLIELKNKMTNIWNGGTLS